MWNYQSVGWCLTHSTGSEASNDGASNVAPASQPALSAMNISSNPVSPESKVLFISAGSGLTHFFELVVTLDDPAGTDNNNNSQMWNDALSGH